MSISLQATERESKFRGFCFKSNITVKKRWWIGFIHCNFKHKGRRINIGINPGQGELKKGDGSIRKGSLVHSFTEGFATPWTGITHTSFLLPKTRKANKGVTQTVLHYSSLLFSEDLCRTPQTKPRVISGEINHATRFNRTAFLRAR